MCDGLRRHRRGFPERVDARGAGGLVPRLTREAMRDTAVHERKPLRREHFTQAGHGGFEQRARLGIRGAEMHGGLVFPD